jgi:hypothetical protein
MNLVTTGYDGSPHGGSTLAWAVEQARRHHAQRHVLTVVGPRAPRVHAGDLRALRPGIPD